MRKPVGITHIRVIVGFEQWPELMFYQTSTRGAYVCAPTRGYNGVFTSMAELPGLWRVNKGDLFHNRLVKVMGRKLCLSQEHL